MGALLMASLLFWGAPISVAAPPPATCPCTDEDAETRTVTAASQASSPRTSEAPPPAFAPSSPWYGTAAVATDTLALAAMLGGGASNDASLLVLGAAGYLLGAPISYLAQGHSKHALGSLGLRALAGGVATGAVMMEVLGHPCDGEPSCHHAPTTGLAVGALALIAAAVVDDAVLARERPAPTPEPRATFTPIVGPRLALLSVTGAF
jgi:hypothetical protein